MLLAFAKIAARLVWRSMFGDWLPEMGLASALAQFLVLAGAAVLWAAARRRR